MRIITEKDIISIYSMKECIKSVEKALEIQQKGDSNTPVRNGLSIDEHNGNVLFMPTYTNELNEVGIKVISIYPNNQLIGKKSLQSIFILTDGKTGEHKAMIDFSLLTVYRTGALSGIATKLLARENAKSCLVIGCGEQAKGQLLAAIEVRNIQRIYLYNRTKEKAGKMKSFLEKDVGWIGEIIIIDDPDKYLADSDIIICSTNSSKPVFNGSLLMPGTHINGIGSYLPEMQEVDLHVLKKSDKIVVDTLEGVLHEAGDFLIPQETGDWSTDHIFGELGELVMGQKPGRESDSEITFFKSVGFSTLDIVVASEIFKLAEEKATGVKVAL